MPKVFISTPQTYVWSKVTHRTHRDVHSLGWNPWVRWASEARRFWILERHHTLYCAALPGGSLEYVEWKQTIYIRATPRGIHKDSE
jgi:hypothetical protein